MSPFRFSGEVPLMAVDAAHLIYLHDGIGQEWFPMAEVRDHLHHWLPAFNIKARGDLLAGGLGHIPEDGARAQATASLARGLCQARVSNPTKAVAQRSPLKPEVDYELRVLSGRARATTGVAYDGNELQRLAFSLVPREERSLDMIHVWFTERLFATWDEGDRRYHARVSIYGHPSIISTSGMVQGPARDRRHYLARRLGLPETDGGDPDDAESLQFEDPRTAEVAKGYAMQAVFHALTGAPFCDDPRCRLFNAHWQTEMLQAQLGGTDYCARHREELRALAPSGAG